jgi:hypothetical protein
MLTPLINMLQVLLARVSQQCRAARCLDMLVL